MSKNKDLEVEEDKEMLDESEVLPEMQSKDSLDLNQPKDNEDNSIEASSGETNKSEEGQEFVVDPEMLEKLTVGFLSHCLPDLQKAKGALAEILQSQTVLQENIHNENSKLKLSEDVEKTMAKVKLYHSKLLYLKKEMNSLAEKSSKLKKRGVKLHQMKKKEEAQKQEQEEREKMREEMLTAKVAKTRTSNQTDS